jgi:CheY-like chemotaxis protein
MPQLLIIENERRDVEFAKRSAEQSGFSSAINTPSVEAAHALLEKARTEGQDLPDAILLDIDLGAESGLEFLRIRFQRPWLMNIPVVVWTRLGDHYREVCSLFHIHGYVEKSAGEYELNDALQSIVQQPRI